MGDGVPRVAHRVYYAPAMHRTLRLLGVLATCMVVIGSFARVVAQELPGDESTPTVEETPPDVADNWRPIPAPENGASHGTLRLGPWRWYEVDVPDGAKLLVGALRPAGTGPFPVVVYYHGGAGFDGVVLGRAESKQLVSAGFMVVAGGWFAGQNPNDEPRKWPIDGPLAPQFTVLDAARFNNNPDFNSVSRPYAEAIARTAGRLPDADPERVALLGDSRGGCQVLLGGSLPFIRAVVSDSGDCYEGRTAKMTNALAAQQLQAPLLYLHGTLDTKVPTERVRDLESALKQFNKPYELAVYDGGNHVVDGSENPLPVREDARARTIAFLQKYLAP